MLNAVKWCLGLFAAWLLGAFSPMETLPKILNVVATALIFLTGNPYDRATVDPLGDIVANLVIYSIVFLIANVVISLVTNYFWKREFTGERAPTGLVKEISTNNTIMFLPVPILVMLSCVYSLNLKAGYDLKMAALSPFLSQTEKQQFATEWYHVNTKARYDHLDSELIDDLIKYGVRTTPNPYTATAVKPSG